VCSDSHSCATQRTHSHNTPASAHTHTACMICIICKTNALHSQQAVSRQLQRLHGQREVVAVVNLMQTTMHSNNSI
jgi:hypothetical protein